MRGRREEELVLLLQGLHDAMVEAFGVPVRDHYQILTEHEPSRLILEDTGLGFERSDKRVLIQVTTRPRSREMKERFYALAVKYLASSVLFGLKILQSPASKTLMRIGVSVTAGRNS